MKLSSKERRELVAWAKGALHGLDQSAAFVGVLDNHPLDATRIEFTLQLGHALLNEKPIILTVPHGVALPAKLEAVADAVVRYNPDDLASMQPGLLEAFTRLGINRQ